MPSYVQLVRFCFQNLTIFQGKSLSFSTFLVSTWHLLYSKWLINSSFPLLNIRYVAIMAYKKKLLLIFIMLLKFQIFKSVSQHITRETLLSHEKFCRVSNPLVYQNYNQLGIYLKNTAGFIPAMLQFPNNIGALSQFPVFTPQEKL
mgnify:CR=1 FL=1